MKLFLLLLSSFCFVIQIQSQTIVTAAGNGMGQSTGDGGPFSKATFGGAAHMIYDKAGNLYLSDRRPGLIRKVDAVTGIITTFASGFYTPLGMAFDPQEKFMYVAENACIYKVDMSSGARSVFAGTAYQLCTSFYLCGEGGLAIAAKLDNPGGVAVDSIGNVYIADNGNSRIRKVDVVTGIITTYAGGGGCNCVGLGDGGPANKGTLLFPSDILFDHNGDLIISDGGLHNIRKVDSKTGIITTIAGGVQGGAWGYTGDGGPAVNARLKSPSGISIDKNDNLYIADAGNYVVRKIDKAGIITTVAGNGTEGYSGDCGPALKAQMNTPIHAVVTPTGSILIGDYYNSVFREVINSDPNVITTSSNSLCVNSTIALKNSARGGVWQSSNTSIATVSADGVVTGLSEGKVDISYYISKGCNNNSATVSLTVRSIPVLGEIKGGTTLCQGSSIQATISTAGGVWSSSDSSIASADAGGLVKGIAGGAAIIKYKVSNGQCSNADSIQLVVNALPALPPITGDTSICVNSITSLTNAAPGGTWSINNTAIGRIDPVTGITSGISAGKALVTYALTNGCGSATVKSVLIVNPLPQFSLGNDTAICSNSKLLFDVSLSNVSFARDNGSTKGSRVVTLPQSYWLKMTDGNGCVFSDTIIVPNKPLPAVHLGNDTTLCSDLALLLNASGPSIASYRWQDGSTQAAYAVTKAGKYNVVITGSNGCTNSDTVKINYLSAPLVNLGNSGTICPGNR